MMKNRPVEERLWTYHGKAVLTPEGNTMTVTRTNSDLHVQVIDMWEFEEYHNAINTFEAAEKETIYLNCAS